MEPEQLLNTYFLAHRDLWGSFMSQTLALQGSLQGCQKMRMVGCHVRLSILNVFLGWCCGRGCHGVARIASWPGASWASGFPGATFHPRGKKRLAHAVVLGFLQYAIPFLSSYDPVWGRWYQHATRTPRKTRRRRVWKRKTMKRRRRSSGTSSPSAAWRAAARGAKSGPHVKH